MSEFRLDFVGVGPQRTASSWLSEVIAAHPQVVLPRGVKETMFFDQRYSKGLSWYAWHFEHAAQRESVSPDRPAESPSDRPAVRFGEIAPTYFDQPEAARRIQHLAPNCRILINVRNPIERCYSLFRHHLSKGRLPNDFPTALQRMPRLITSGHYARYGPLWEELFGADQVRYVLNEDVRQRPQQVLDQVCEFLDVAPVELPEIGHLTINTASPPRSRLAARCLSATATALRSMRLHSIVKIGKQAGLTRFYRGGEDPSPLTDELYAQLEATFNDDICWLEQRLGTEFPDWRRATTPEITNGPT